MPCHTEQFSENDIPDLRGYVAIVTGGNSGIGYETANQLALRGARVYIASRSKDRVQTAIQAMSQSTLQIMDLHFLRLDLTDLGAVKAAAEEFKTREGRLDILINNAGVMATPYALTVDRFETQWQVNYLAPHIFTQTLMPLLLSTASYHRRENRVRVINVASGLAFTGPKTIQFDDINMTSADGMFQVWQRYGHSKQASIRDAKEMNDRYSSQGITAYSVHPGVVRSNLQSSDPSMVGSAMRALMKVAARTTPLEGALTTLFCATSLQAVAQQGKFHVPVGKLDERADKWLDDVQVNAQLWGLSEDLGNRIQ